MRITQEEELMKSACERWNLKKKWCRNRLPHRFQHPLFPGSAWSGVGNKLKIAHFKRLSTTDNKKMPNI